MSELPKIVSCEQLPQATSRFLSDLETELAWEWKWEKTNRKWSQGIHWAEWACRLILLAAAVYQLNVYGKGSQQQWLIAFIAFFAMLNIALPLVAYTFRFQQRQEVHDRIAREYDVIRTELRAQQITLAQAVERYSKIREQPTEPLVRKTP